MFHSLISLILKNKVLGVLIELFMMECIEILLAIYSKLYNSFQEL